MASQNEDGSVSSDGMDVPQLSQKKAVALLSNCIRVVSAFVAEGESATEALGCKYFVRAFQGAQADGALLIKTSVDNLPNNATDKFYTIKQRDSGRFLDRMKNENALTIDFKSLAHKLNIETKERKDGSKRIKHEATTLITLSEYQFKYCQILVVISISNPEWIAVVPRAYFPRAEVVGGAGHRILKFAGKIVPEMAQAIPLPPTMAPFIMPSAYLVPALNNVVSHAENPGTKLFNPYTGLGYDRSDMCVPTLRPFGDLFPNNDTKEFKFQEKVWRGFKDHPTNTGFTAFLPTFTPLTWDLRLDHVSGKSVFLELKFASIKVVSLQDGGQRLSQQIQFRHGIGGYFTFRASWDFMLSVDEDNRYGYLICKDDWPEGIWHTTSNTNWLSFDLPNGGLESSRIDLRNNATQIATRMCEIINEPSGFPRKATLTSTDIINIRPCPEELLAPDRPRMRRTGRNEDEDNEDNGDEDDVQMLLDQAAAGVDGAGDDSSDDESDQEQTTAVQRFVSKSATGRVMRQGHAEKIREFQVFDLLLRQSARNGRGCPIYLGEHHPFGSMGFIDHIWTVEEKRIFEKFNRPPCWVGSLSNSVPMITISTVWSPWYNTYSPDEGTRNEFRLINDSRPSIIISKNFSREMNHMLEQQWIIPSEFFPAVHVGAIKNPDRWYKGPLILEEEHTIDAFATNVDEFAAVLSRFLSGRDNISVGVGNVQVDPSKYLKTIYEYRLSADINYNRCIFDPQT